MIELKNVSKTYRTGKVAVRALQNVSLKIKQGEFVAIMGASGSGKSTLLHLLGFLDRPDSGSYIFYGKEMKNMKDDELAVLRNHTIGFVFQQFHLLRRASALHNVELPLIYAGKKHMQSLAHERLKDVNLQSRQLHKPSELSGGEQQRVAIARALINEAVLILADEPTGNLDTKSAKDIMSILETLHEKGKTIIMVTHEKEIAEYAERIIYMRDGKIMDEKRTKPAKDPQTEKLAVTDITGKKHSAFGQIELTEHIKQALGAILSNKMRSFLSMLGILIGVGSVIAMLALGQGAKESMEKRLKSLGSNLLSIQGGSAKVRGVARGTGTVTRFTEGDIQAMRGLKPLVKKATGYVSGSGQVVYKNENWNTRIEGVGYDYGQMRAAIPEIGRWFTNEELRGREKVTIIGLTIADKLFADKNPIGEIIKINRINFKVIGIAPEKGSRGWRDQDDLIYIPVTTAMYRVLGKHYLDGMYAEIDNVESIDEAEKQIKNLIIKRHRIYKNPDDYFHMHNMSEIQEMLQSTTKTMSVLLGSIAAISLLVGGIGIMNIMLVSVTERTREIGLRKAVGAHSGDIMFQFLIESVVMTVSGGFIGMLFGITISALISNLAGWATKVTISSIFLALTFSIAVGIFFGLWPARKAANLNPIEALRYE